LIVVIARSASKFLIDARRGNPEPYDSSNFEIATSSAMGLLWAMIVVSKQLLRWLTY